MPSRRAGAAGVALPATAWAVLGLLSFGRELSGYDLKKWADNSLRFFYWSPAASQVYAELRRLEARGFARSRIAPGDGLRPKRLYRITTAGRAALRDWVRHAGYEPTVVKHSTLLRVWLGHLADARTLSDAVGAHRAAVADELAAARRAHELAPRDLAHAVVVTRWAVRRAEAELSLTDALLADLDALDAPGTPGTPGTPRTPGPPAPTPAGATSRRPTSRRPTSRSR